MIRLCLLAFLLVSATACAKYSGICILPAGETLQVSKVTVHIYSNTLSITNAKGENLMVGADRCVLVKEAQNNE